MARARTRGARRTTRARGGRAARGGGIAQYLIPIGVAGALLWYLMPRAEAAPGGAGGAGGAGGGGGQGGGGNGGGGGMNGGGGGGGMNGGGTAPDGGTPGGNGGGGGGGGGGSAVIPRTTGISQIAVPIPDYDPTVQAYSYRVSATKVNFRGGPVNGQVLYHLNSPDRVIVPNPSVETEGFVGAIDPVNGQAGWIAKRYLDDERVHLRGAEGEGLPSNRRGSGTAQQNLLPNARFDRFANVRAPGRARVGGWGRCGR